MKSAASNWSLPCRARSPGSSAATGRQRWWCSRCADDPGTRAVRSARRCGPGRARELLQQLQHVVRGGGLSESWKDFLKAIAVRVGVAVRHGIHDQCHVVAEIVGAARGGFHPGTGRHTRQDDLRDAAPAQIVVQVVPRNAPQRSLVTRWSLGCCCNSGMISDQPSGNEKLGGPASVRPGARPATLTSTPAKRAGGRHARGGRCARRCR